MNFRALQFKYSTGTERLKRTSVNNFHVLGLKIRSSLILPDIGNKKAPIKTKQKAYFLILGIIKIYKLENAFSLSENESPIGQCVNFELLKWNQQFPQQKNWDSTFIYKSVVYFVRF